MIIPIRVVARRPIISIDVAVLPRAKPDDVGEKFDKWSWKRRSGYFCSRKSTSACAEMCRGAPPVTVAAWLKTPCRTIKRPSAGRDCGSFVPRKRVLENVVETAVLRLGPGGASCDFPLAEHADTSMRQASQLDAKARSPSCSPLQPPGPLLNSIDKTSCREGSYCPSEAPSGSACAPSRRPEAAKRAACALI